MKEKIRVPIRYKILSVFFVVASLVWAGLGFFSSDQTRSINQKAAKIVHAEEKSDPTPSTASTSVVEEESVQIEIAGEAIAIKPRYLEYSEVTLPTDKSVSYLYGALSKRAEQGEAVAARLLSDLITRCNETYPDRESHDKAIVKLIEDRIFPTANPQFQGIKISEDQIALAQEQFAREFEYCKDLGNDERKEAVKWARKAAEAGDFQGITQLIKSSEVSGIEKVSLMERQWQEFGFFDSTTGLSTILSGLSRFPGYEDVEPDPVKAYAYHLVSSKTYITLLETSDPIEALWLRVKNFLFEIVLKFNLGYQEQKDAEREAISMLKENSQCCTFYKFALKYHYRYSGK